MDILEGWRFTRDLHTEPEARFGAAPDLDWRSAPTFFPQRFDATILPLPWGDAAACRLGRSAPPLTRLGCWLGMSLGCHRTRMATRAGERGAVPIMPRRVLASGGAAYPTDLYCGFGADWDAVLPGLASYLWVYLPQFHGLAAHCPAPETTAGIRLAGSDVGFHLATVLSRTAFKYREFAYRLTAVDSGIALGRLLASGRQFADYVRLDLGGKPDFELLEPEELIAARLVSRFETGALARSDRDAPASAIRCRIDKPRDIRREAISSGLPPAFARLAPFLNGRARPRARPGPAMPPVAVAGSRTLPLPLPAPAPAVTLEAIHRRRSAAQRFNGRFASPEVLSTCLHAAERALSDLRERGVAEALLAIRIFCATVRVENIVQAGALFNAERCVLETIEERAIVARLNGAMLMRTFDLGRSAFVIHLAADLGWLNHPLGLAAYRNTQIAVGVALDAASMAAAAAGLSAHAFLGFSAPRLASLYGLDPEGDMQVAAQLCVGYSGPTAQMETSIVG